MGLWDFLAVAAVVAIVSSAIGEGYRQYLKARTRGAGSELAERVDALEHEVAALRAIEDRTRTLETIVTDQSYELNHEIGKLASGNRDT